MNRRRFLATSALAVGSLHTAFADEGVMPGLDGAVAWLNSAPLSTKSLRGKVVLVNFWTYSCINSLRPLPFLKAWAAKYREAGLVVIGVHTPEFDFEKQHLNVGRAVRDLKIAYPVAVDSNQRVWREFNNEYWPAFYFIDGKGRISAHRFGEGDYAEFERIIRTLLEQNGAAIGAIDSPLVSASGVEVPASRDVESQETYIGYRRAEHFDSPGQIVRDSKRTYSAPVRQRLNRWGLAGEWDVGEERAMLASAPGGITFRFHSRDLHLVMGAAYTDKPVRFKVTLDGNEPGADCGTDSGPDGSGVVGVPRLYQLIREKGVVMDRTFQIEFLDAGVETFVFTFG
jgi:thiol-disulfide isomerase/thioredoxin